MTKTIRLYQPRADIHTSRDFYDQHTIYKGTWGSRMLRQLHQRGYNVKEIAGIFDVIDRETLTWEQFLATDWQSA